jgi:hypothetical protein
MTRYLVLLRGINVGGRHKVPMAALRELLESHGHTKVSTYIASGNVVAGHRRDLLAAAQRATDEEPPQQDRGHAGLQVDDDPELGDDDGAARAHGSARGRPGRGGQVPGGR